MDHQETDEKLVSRYVNCLKFSIQDEMSINRVHSMEEAYQLALKAEEKQNRQFSQRNRGERRGTSSSSRGGFNYGRGESSQGAKKEEDTQQGNLINHEEENFKGVEVTLVAKEDLMCVLGVVWRVIEHLNSQIITCKS